MGSEKLDRISSVAETRTGDFFNRKKFPGKFLIIEFCYAEKIELVETNRLMLYVIGTIFDSFRVIRRESLQNSTKKGFQIRKNFERLLRCFLR